MSDVFLSYKAEDRSRVESLVDALTADGLEVWWDAQIAAGSEWRENIQEQLDAARCVVVVWSKRSVGPEGHFVRDEASRAQRRGTYVPIRIDKVDPPLGFGEIHVISLQGWRGDRSDPRYLALLETVRAVMAGEARHAPTVREPVMLSRRAAVAGGIFTAAGLAGVGGWQLLRPTPSERSSIAVLPFANLSGDHSQAYFAAGVAEELRSALSRLEGLQVAGRTSSEAVQNEDARTAARRLRVESILSGSVRRAQGLVRVTSQLLDGRSGLERWSETYDRADGNILAIQTDIAEKVMAALSVELGTAAADALKAGGTGNAAAYDLFLRASDQARNDDSEDSLRQANALLDAAIASDPRFAKAHAAKARNLSYIADVGRSPAETASGYASAVAAARRALALAPRLPDGYAALADALYGQRKIREALEQVEKGLSFAPNDLQLLQAAVITSVAAGQTRRALAHADRMVELDPLNPLPHRRRYYALFYDRQYDECIAEARRTQRLAPTLALPAYFIALSLIMKGQEREAQRHLETMPADLTVRLAGEAIVAAKLGDRRRSDQKLEQLASIYGDAASYQFAQAYAQRGEADRALAALARGLAVGDPGLNTLAVDPLLDPIRKDRRFIEMVRSLEVADSA